jgi:hypothetical protein
MLLVHDVLDKQLLDRHREKMGRVDGIVLELSDGSPPRVTAIEVGGAVLARRLHPTLGRWAEALGRTWGNRQRPVTRIPWSVVHRNGNVVEADVDALATPALAWELWLRRHVMEHLPGK